ncbi:MAG: FAD-linked oxidase [Herminiimonas sp.]|nr:FAD-linked oxidase [Herminiimonas sp.]
MVTTPIAAWGRLAREPHTVVSISDGPSATGAIATATKPTLPYGNGRSYGDVALNPGGSLLLTRRLDRFIEFDRDSGLVTCEAGVLLRDIIELALPHGWFPPVLPGTQFVTAGGAIANDVHGKGHHVTGCFGEHLRRLTLLRTDGTKIDCGPERQQDWFSATVGGMGLTGLIVNAQIQLRRVVGPWLDTESCVFESLDQFFALSRESEREWEYSVAWVDCGNHRAGHVRGVFFRGNHSSCRDKKALSRARVFPVTPPFSLVNTLSLRIFNEMYFRAHRARHGFSRQHYLPFFFPLDNVLEWNRIYGVRGFYQYQCVVPEAVQQSAVKELLAAISDAGAGSFLAVLKTFGDRTSPGMMSFPMHGTTLALDFPNKGERTLRLFERLNDLVKAAGGRLYPAKDACMPSDLFKAGYPGFSKFLKFRDPGISSAMSRRLMGA